MNALSGQGKTNPILCMKIKFKMGRICAASFCRKSLDARVSCYPFPSKRDTMRLQMWQKRLLVSDTPNAFACHRHFSDHQFHCDPAGQRIKMKRNALPDKNIVRRTRDPKDPLDAVCRLCLERSVMDYQMIFPAWPNPDVPTADDIAELFGIVITPDDLLPRIVCVTCTTKIKYMKRIRDQFQKNDAILRTKFVTQKNEVAPPPRKQVAPIMEPNYYSRSDTDPKITAVASLGMNPVDIPPVASGSDGILQGTYGSVVYVQEGETYQQFRIINSGQIMPTGEHEEVVSTSVKVEPTDTESDLVEVIDTEILYADNGEMEPENEQVKIEYQQLDFGLLHTEDDSQPEELEEHPPEKKLRVDKPFRYADQIKVEKDGK
ncbi:uncharacterized protein LOC135697253 [Ochlerotatus camptorhynchus]|uniref:uncharacterized protein LOC135697253 n=1 Tax=Ochlerotatus camptorhynchus TaxID=644619 RepID=UPI0031E0621D